MHSIDDYLDRVRTRHSLKSDRKIGELVGIAPNTINHYRTRRAWPSEEAMSRIAAAAGMDPETALLELGYWRTTARHEHLAARHFLNLIERTAPVILLTAALFAFTGNDAKASNQNENIAPTKVSNLYIMRLLSWARLRCS